jgi:hypothetical protein
VESEGLCCDICDSLLTDTVQSQSIATDLSPVGSNYTEAGIILDLKHIYIYIYIYTYIQGVPGGKDNILGGHSIGHSK